MTNPKQNKPEREEPVVQVSKLLVEAEFILNELVKVGTKNLSSNPELLQQYQNTIKSNSKTLANLQALNGKYWSSVNAKRIILLKTFPSKAANSVSARNELDLFRKSLEEAQKLIELQNQQNADLVERLSKFESKDKDQAISDKSDNV